MQFTDPQIKLRLHEFTGEELDFVPGTKDRYVPVIKDGIEILTTNVGCQLPTLEAAQLALLDAYRTYYLVHRDMYKKTYNKPFIDFIRKVKDETDRLYRLVEHEEAKLNGQS